MPTLSIARRFLLAGLLILGCGMSGIGWWVGQQIATGVIHRTAATTALFAQSFVAPHLQALGTQSSLPPADAAALGQLFQQTPLGQEIVAFKVWDAHEARILYSSNPTLVGRTFPVEDELRGAWQGHVGADLSDLTAPENVEERKHWSQLLETYSPVRLTGTGQIIAVAEFYQTSGDLNAEILTAQHQSWLIVALVALAMYGLLAGFVQGTSRTITRQERLLRAQVADLTRLLTQNASLHERVRRAAANSTALNERFLRRVGAELHDGLGQDLGLALLRLDHVQAHMEQKTAPPTPARPRADLEVVKTALHHALGEVRTIAAGLSLPQLEKLSLMETIHAAVSAHEHRTGSQVLLTLGALPDSVPFPLKIAIYRVIQEALYNAYRHAGGAGQRVGAWTDSEGLRIEVRDEGPGRVPDISTAPEIHLGLVGMRERVESLGGHFSIESTPGQGTAVGAIWPWPGLEQINE